MGGRAASPSPGSAGPAVDVRPVTRDDWDELLDLLEAVASERQWIGHEAPIDRQERRGRWKRFEDERNHEGFAAVAGGGIVGHLGLHDMNGLVEIGMYVAAEWRGRGVGTALMQAGLDWARIRHAHKITLQMWPHNEAGRALYAKFGFVEEGYLKRHWKRRNGDIWDAVVMGLHL